MNRASIIDVRTGSTLSVNENHEVCIPIVKTTEDGKLDLAEPIRIYWIKFTKNGVIKQLTRIQDNFAYGLKLAKYQY